MNAISVPANPFGFTQGGAEDKTSESLSAVNDPQVFEGPRGSTLGFRVHASLELQTSTYLFEQLGFTETVGADGFAILGIDPDDPAISGKVAHFIDSTVRITGANTGYILDVPIRYVKIK